MHKRLIPLFFLFLIAQNGRAQSDTVPPILVCQDILLVQLSDFCYGYVKAQNLVDTVYDDSQFYELTFRRVCTGDGFPATDSIIFLEPEFAPKIEVWARDSAGNTSTCTMTLVFHDSGMCDAGSNLKFTTKDGEGIDDVMTHIIGGHCSLDSVDYQIPGTPGVGASWYSWTPGTWMSYFSLVPATGYEYEVFPSKNNDPLNGVTTYDLALISKHILGLETLNSPYQILAADVNLDGNVTTYDILLLRRLILGLIPKLPHGKSWRFIPDGYSFANPQNPSVPPIPDKITVPKSESFPWGSHHFLGIKIGDVNFTSNPN